MPEIDYVPSSSSGSGDAKPTVSTTAAATTSSGAVVHKPDQVTASPIGPPPPYSPPSNHPTRSTATAVPMTYGALGGEQQQQYPSSSSSNRHEVPAAPRNPKNKKQKTLSQRLKKLFKKAAAGSGNHDNDSSSSDDDEDDHRHHDVPRVVTRRCKRWAKYLLLALFIALAVWKYSDLGSSTTPPPLISCEGLSAVYWDDLPQELAIEKNIDVFVEGKVTGGRVMVHRLQQSGDSGSVQARFRVAPPTALSSLSYSYHQGRDAQLSIKLPPQESDICVEVDMDIWLPEKGEALRVAVPNVEVQLLDPLENMDLVDIHATNGPIHMLGTFEGKELRLKSSNGNIQLDQPVKKADSVDLHTSNAAITVDTINSKHSIDMIVDGSGSIIAQDLIADDKVRLHTANDQVRIDSSINAAIVVIENSNGAIDIARAGGDGDIASFVAKTSNAYIQVAQLQSEKDAQLNLESSNGPITAHVVCLCATHPTLTPFFLPLLTSYVDNRIRRHILGKHFGLQYGKSRGCQEPASL